MALTPEKLLNFLDEKMMVDIEDIDAQTPLFSSGLLDSFNVVDWIVFIEQESGIKLDQDEIILDNIDSIERVLKLVESHLS